MKKKILVTLLAVALVLSCALITVFAMYDMEKPLAVMKGMAGLDTMPQYADANGDGEVNVLDVIELMREQKLDGVYLNSITLDDANYSIGQFSQTKMEYTVQLPAGRPAIPQISAQANSGLDVEITQAYIPDGETEGTAYAVVSDGQYSRRYTVKFVRDIENGFVLQYDDRYTLPIAADGYTYSSNNAALTVDANGLMTAKAVTNTPITVTATKDSDTKTFTVDRIEKAHINLFFMTGQSNGQGCFDNVSMDGNEVDESAQERYYGYMAQVEKIGQNGRVYSYDVHPRNENIAYLRDVGLLAGTETLQNRFYDLNVLVKQGHFNSLGKTWYDATGEKVVFLQSAWSGAPIESWLNPDEYSVAGKYNGNNYWQTTKAGYERLLPILEENYEIIRKANFWCQGETAMTAYYSKSAGNYIFSSNAAFDNTNLMTPETYSMHFKNLHNDMVDEFGIEFSGIMMVRNRTTSNRAKISSLVSAFFELVNDPQNDIFVATRTFTEIAKTAATGNGFIDTGDLHYSQIGYNYHGNEAATNFFGVVYGGPDYRSTGVELIDTDGIKRLPDNYAFELEAGKIYQVAALTIPRNCGENVTYASDNTAVATVDQFGVIKGIAAGTANITVTADSGAKKTVAVSVFGMAPAVYNYRWDFDNTLTSSKDKNDLTLSPLSKNNGGNFEYYNGSNNAILYHNLNINLGELYRPDFQLEKSFNLDSDSNWTIEWRGAVSSGNQCLLMGQTIPESVGTTGADHHAGYIYLWTKAWPDTTIYPIRIVPETGSTIVLDMTATYYEKMKSVNTWKIEYNKDTKKVTLYWKNGTVWTKIDQKSAGAFSMEITNIFGRLNGKASQNFVGYMDYIDVHVETMAKVEN